MEISTYARSLLIQQRSELLQTRLFKANEQLVTGKKASQFSELGGQSAQTLSLRAKIRTVVQYQETIGLTNRRMEVMHESLERTNKIGHDVSTEVLTGLYDNEAKLPYLAETAGTAADEMITLMNARFGERYLFGGAKSDAAPVTNLQDMLRGDPSDPAGATRGLMDLVDSRAVVDAASPAADLPAGQWPGHVEVRTDGTTVEFRLDELAFEGFGMEIKELRYDQATGGTASIPAAGVAEPPPAGPDTVPAVSVDTSAVTFFAGQTFRLMVEMPDGTDKSIEIRAVTGNGPHDRDTFRIDYNAQVNFTEAFTGALERTATTDLKAASAQQAATEFFDFPPKVVQFDGGSGQWQVVEDDVGEVVRWYDGQRGGDPRDGARVKVDDGTIVDYGIRADEAPLADTLKQLALLAGFEYDAQDTEPYKALAERSGSLLSDASERVRTLLGAHGTRQELVAGYEERHAATEAMATGQLNDMENVSQQEVASRILTLESQLQASYELTSRGQNLSLVRFLS
ncbi:MAG: hypothetical protein RID91_14345 [Azospirillaceae bacterium]